MIDLVLASAPAEKALSLVEAKTHLRVDAGDLDGEISANIDAAVGRLDGFAGVLGRALVTQSWTLYLSCFPVSAIALPLPPLQSVTSITYVDADGQTQTVAADDYVVHAGALALVEPAYGKSWPSARYQRRAIAVTYVCGYGPASAVPGPIKSALKLILDELHDGAETAEAVRRLTAPYRVART